MHPTFGSLPVADFTPGVIFLDDLDRNGLLTEHPFYRIAHPWPDTHVHLIGAQRDKSVLRRLFRTRSEGIF